MKGSPADVSALVPNDGRENANPSELSFWALVVEDFETHNRGLFSQGFWALFWHRFGNWRMSVRPRVLRAPLTVIYRVMLKLTEWMAGIYLPYTVIVGRRVRLEHFGGMILVANRIGDDVIIRQNTTFGISTLDKLQARPDIGDRVQIGAGAVLIGGIEIGPDTIIGANAVVTKSLPAGVVAGGVPAHIIRKRDQRAGDG
jgi:serine O-acetyltransferase